jgi:hypothetical protein
MHLRAICRPSTFVMFVTRELATRQNIVLLFCPTNFLSWVKECHSVDKLSISEVVTEWETCCQNKSRNICPYPKISCRIASNRIKAETDLEKHCGAGMSSTLQSVCTRKLDTCTSFLSCILIYTFFQSCVYRNLLVGFEKNTGTEVYWILQYAHRRFRTFRFNPVLVYCNNFLHSLIHDRDV